MKRISGRHAVLLVVIAVLAALCGLKIAGRAAHLKKYENMPGTGAAERKTAAEELEAETETEELETEPETEAEPRDPDAERTIDFTSLRERNPDVVAWLYIPGTVINYPILWRENDNSYYLRRDIDKKEGSYEGVYLDGEDRPDLSGLQNLFYGHHMKNRTMFTAICDFKEESFFAEHRKLYLYTPEHTYILRPMACLYTDAGAEKRRIRFADRMEFDAYVDQMTRGCAFRDLPAGGIDRLFSFVTCSYEFSDARTILYCYETDTAGNPVIPAALDAEGNRVEPVKTEAPGRPLAAEQC